MAFKYIEAKIIVKCDNLECPSKRKHRVPVPTNSEKAAIRMLRGSGWYITSSVCYCPSCSEPYLTEMRERRIYLENQAPK